MRSLKEAENAVRELAADADLLIRTPARFLPRARLSPFIRPAYYIRISTCQQYLHRLTLILACTHEIICMTMQNMEF